ncbi:MAG: GbsR/MarR family transcriptional regulator [Myxococcota bacterium]
MSDNAAASLKRLLVEEFGNIYESHGFPRLKGLIVGLLLAENEPQSLDDMAQALGRSKGPISTTVRELANMGLIRKVEGPENRRDYYVAHADIFHNNFKFNMLSVRRNKAVAEEFLRKMHGVGATGSVITNLEHMQLFYQLMESFYERFSAEWEQTRKEKHLDERG